MGAITQYEGNLTVTVDGKANQRQVNVAVPGLTHEHTEEQVLKAMGEQADRIRERHAGSHVALQVPFKRGKVLLVERGQ